jgi:hypothetical protein
MELTEKEKKMLEVALNMKNEAIEKLTENSNKSEEELTFNDMIEMSVAVSVMSVSLLIEKIIKEEIDLDDILGGEYEALNELGKEVKDVENITGKKK